MDKQSKVLLVEDEADFRQLIKLWLESKGYLVTEAPDGNTAIQKVKEGLPDIIFLDLHMPVLDGVDTLKKIRKFNKDVPVVIISAYTDDPRAAEAMRYGVSGVFSKDEQFPIWASLLETVLRRHKQLKKS